MMLLFMRVGYIFTTEGVALNNVVFRPWSEFTGFEINRRGILLHPKEGLRPFKIKVIGKNKDETILLLKQYLSEQTIQQPKRKLCLGVNCSRRVNEKFYNKQRRRFNLKSKAGHWIFWISIIAIVIIGIIGYSVAVKPGTDPAPDRSGLNTGSAESLVGVAPANITQDELDQASTTEPFAAQLANVVEQNRLAANFIWTLVAGFLVMFMQAGFALAETGFCRAKNAGHTMFMNFMVYALGMLGFYVIGFALMCGGVGIGGVSNLGGLATLNKEFTIGGWGLFGYKGFFLSGTTYDVGVAVMFLFQMVFMDTTATIPTGSMAERWKTLPFIIYGFFVGAIIYPIFGNWAWGGGWLAQLGTKAGLGAGYVDFAGSGVVHAIGGWTALAGAAVLGPRLGKFNKDRSPNAIPGHSLILAALGVFILAFGWFGFNPGSTLGASQAGNLRIGMVAVTTMLACAASSMTSMAYTWMKNGKPDFGMTLNGMLAGLVAITAPSGYVSPTSSIIIGGVAGLLVCFAVWFVENKLHVDDPVGAISVHGFNGLWGQLAVGLFADGTMNYNGTVVKGLFYGDPKQFVAQIIGAVVAFAWAFGISYLFFKALDKTIGMRVAPEAELAGLDVPELGSPGYAFDTQQTTPLHN
jgi:Amt family ammonium transporter